MNKVVADLTKEYSLYTERDLAILAKKYFGITSHSNKKSLIEKMVSIELKNSSK